VLSAGDIYFTFGPEDWAPRQVGDDVMAPTPSFVGQPLNDIVLYKDRLAFLSRDSVMFSEVREPLNFWPTSIMTSVDSDPIDVQASTTTDGASDFHSGVATEAGLLLLTSSGQFLARPSLGEGFTPKTVHIDQVSRYQSENASKPIFVGSRVYWVTEQGANSKVWEYRVFSDASGDAPVGSATEITNHAPRFLPKNIYKVTANDNESIICFLSSDEPTSVYVYQYLLSGNDRLQSAWSKWTTDQPIINGNFLNRNLNLLLDRTETISGPQTVLEYMPPRLSDPNLSDSPVTDMPVCLDQRVQYTILSAANPSGLHVGTFKEILLPMPAPRDPLDVDKVHPDLQVLVGGSGSLAGTLILASSISVESNSQEPNSIFVEIEDSVFNEPLFIGKRYVQDIELSTCIIKSSATRTSAPRPYTDGRLQLRTFSIKFSKSGPFTVYVNNGGTVYSYNYYDPWVLGDPFGPGSKSHGEFKVDVGGRNTETSLQLVNDSPFLSVFIGARYEASWSTRSKRM